MTGDLDAPRRNRFAAMAAFLFARHGLYAMAQLTPRTGSPLPSVAIGGLVVALVLVALVPRRIVVGPPAMPAQSPYRAAPLRVPPLLPSAASLAPLGALAVPSACLAAGAWVPVDRILAHDRLSNGVAVIASIAWALHFARVATRGSAHSPLRVFGLSLLFGAGVWLIAMMNWRLVGIPQLDPVAAIALGLMGTTGAIGVGYVALSTRRASALPIALWLIGESRLAALSHDLLPDTLFFGALALVALVSAWFFFRKVNATQARFE